MPLGARPDWLPRMSTDREDLGGPSDRPTPGRYRDFVTGAGLTIFAVAVNAVLPFRLELGQRATISVSLVFVVAVAWFVYTQREWSWALINGGLSGGLFAFLWTTLFSVPGLTDLLWLHLNDLNSCGFVVAYLAGWLIAMCGSPAALFVVASQAAVAVHRLQRPVKDR